MYHSEMTEFLRDSKVNHRTLVLEHVCLVLQMPNFDPTLVLANLDTYGIQEPGSSSRLYPSHHLPQPRISKSSLHYSTNLSPQDLELVHAMHYYFDNLPALTDNMIGSTCKMLG